MSFLQCQTKRRKLMNKKLITIAVLSGMIFSVRAQEAETIESQPKGKAIVQIFTDAHSGLGKDNGDKGFNLNRGYLGYEYKLNDELTMKAVIDVGRSRQVDDYERIAYAKNAFVTWEHDRITLSGGLISTTQFKTQESFWGKRYVEKSFQDAYDFGSSADLGVSFAYRFADWISADVIMANGEGYKNIQVGDGFQYGAGVTLKPLNGLTLRFYGSYNEEGTDGGTGIGNFATFLGYSCKAFNIGAEYNYQANASHVEGQDQNGYSVYSTVRLGKNINVFGRWDYLTSKNDWNTEDDCMTGLIGAEFKLGKYIKLAPNFRIKNPTADGAENSYYAYLNCSFSI